MKIQSNGSLRVYLSSSNSQPKSDLTSSPSTGAGSVPSSQVNLSKAAQRLAANETSTYPGMSVNQVALLDAVANDPTAAEQIAYGLATVPSAIFYDIRGTNGGEPLRKLSTGRMVDDAFKQKFSEEAAVVDANLNSLYFSEKARGTDPRELLAKMFNYINTQSLEFRDATGWSSSENTVQHV